MTLLSRDNPARSLIFLCLGYIVMGYVLFFIARALPTPAWGPGLMAWCAPVIKAIHTAMQVGLLKSHDPFPIQLVILYCALGSFFLMLYSTAIAFLHERVREKWFSNTIRHTREKNWSRGRLFFISLLILFFFISMFYIGFFDDTAGRNVNLRRTIGMYSPTLFATSLFLGLSLMSLFITDGIVSIYLVFSRHLKSPHNN